MSTTAPLSDYPEADRLSSEPGGIELFEMANLPQNDTGIEGTVYISTAQSSHGPRVEWYPGRPGRRAPCLPVTIEPEPRAINHDLPGSVAAGAAGQVAAWVALNRQRLLDFWNAGETSTRDEVNTFIDGLQKLP